MSQTSSKLRNSLKKIDEAINGLSGGPTSYYLERLDLYVDTLFGRFAPFKRGDRVRLLDSFVTDDKSHGWYGSQHFLTKDALGTVYDVDLNDEGFFTASIEFDIETYIPSYGENKGIAQVRNQRDKHVFDFSEKWLERVI